MQMHNLKPATVLSLGFIVNVIIYRSLNNIEVPYVHPDCIHLFKINLTIFYLKTLKNVIYSCDGYFHQALLQFNNLSEIIIICSFLFNAENSCGA